MTTWLLLFTTLLPYLPFATVQADAWPAFLNLTPLVGQEKGTCSSMCVHNWVVVSIFLKNKSPLFGEDEPILTSIFFKGVGLTAN